MPNILRIRRFEIIHAVGTLSPCPKVLKCLV